MSLKEITVHVYDETVQESIGEEIWLFEGDDANGKIRAAIGAWITEHIREEDGSRQLPEVREAEELQVEPMWSMQIDRGRYKEVAAEPLIGFILIAVFAFTFGLTIGMFSTWK